MSRGINKDKSFVSFLDLMFESEGEKKPTKKKKKKAELGDLGVPLEFPDEPSAPDIPFNSPRLVPQKKRNVDLTAVGFGQPYYTPKSQAKEETPSEILAKINASKESGELSDEEYAALKGKVAATTSPRISRKGLPTTPGGSGIARNIPKPDVSVLDLPDEIDSYEDDDVDMDPYTGANERIPEPAGSKYASGQKPSAAQATPKRAAAADKDIASYRRIAQGLKADKVKIGDQSMMVAGEKGYEEWQPAVGEEWTEDDLPTKGYVAPLDVQGARKETERMKEKEKLAKIVPKFVLQGMEKAAKDYKELLRPKLEVIKKAAEEYAKYLRYVDKTLASSTPGSNISDEEAELMNSSEGLAALVGSKKRGKNEPSGSFLIFFKRWLEKGIPEINSEATSADIKKLGETIIKEKDKLKDPNINEPKESPYFMPKTMLVKSAFEIINRLGIIDLDDDTPATGDTAAMLHLKTNYKPELSRVEQFLMVRKRADMSDPKDPTGKSIIKGDKAAGDPGFRYFFGEVQAGGVERRYYWDWIRRAARKAGKYPEDADWALKGKSF